MNDFNKILLGLYLAAEVVEQSKKPPMSKEWKRFLFMIEIMVSIVLLCLIFIYWK